MDIDRDGWLDLYVASYLRYSVENDAPCASATGARDYCTPDSYQPLPGRLYLNRRDGTFADVSVTSGIAREYGPGLGLATADFNGDGWIDIYVANDGKENQLWMNRRNGAFENAALLSGVALPVTGKAEASMGVDAGDFDDDGDEDLFVTELTGEGSNLFVNDGSGLFEDHSAPSGLGPASLGFTGFGTAWLDFDNDGRLDLLSVNGAVQVIESLRQAGDAAAPPPTQAAPAEPRRGPLRGRDRSRRGGAGALGGWSRRSLWRRRQRRRRGRAGGQQQRAHATSRQPYGASSLGRPAADRRRGARHVGRAGRGAASGRPHHRGGEPVPTAAMPPPTIPGSLVGLADSADVRTVRVTWPAGTTEVWTQVPVDQYTTLVEGKGR